MKKKILIVVLSIAFILSLAVIFFSPPVIIHSDGIIVGKRIEEFNPYQISFSEVQAVPRNKFKNLIFFNWWKNDEVSIREDMNGVLKSSHFQKKYNWLWLNDKDNNQFSAMYAVTVNDVKYYFVYLSP